MAAHRIMGHHVTIDNRHPWRGDGGIAPVDGARRV
jgi:hypothetical protein